MPGVLAERPAVYACHLPIDGVERFYHLDGDALEFFKTASGIKDEERLKAHVIEIQREAYKARSPEFVCKTILSDREVQKHAYPCIRDFAFTKYVHSCDFRTELPGRLP